MRQFQTILLDADNTIFDFSACEKEALIQVFQKYNYPFDEEIKSTYEQINTLLWKQFEEGKIDRYTVYTRFGILFNRLGIQDDGIRFEEDYEVILGRQHVFLDDAPEVIEYLSKKYELYIVTNGITATQLQRFQDSKLGQYVKKIFVSEETGYLKPMKEYFDYCFQRIQNFDLKHTLIIGDSLTSDIKGGNNAGISTCWFNLFHQERPNDLRIDYEIKSLKELYQIL